MSDDEKRNLGNFGNLELGKVLTEGQYRLGLGNLGGVKPTGHRWVKGDGDVWYRANKQDRVVAILSQDGSLWNATGMGRYLTKEAALSALEGMYPD